MSPAKHAEQRARVAASLLLSPKRCDRQFEARPMTPKPPASPTREGKQ